LPEIALFLYDGMTALDAVGPYEVLARLPDAQVKFVASTPGPKKTDVGLVLTADSSLEDVPAPDIIVIPGSGKVPGPGGPRGGRVDTPRTPDVEVDNLGLHGIDAARRRRSAAGQARDQPLGGTRLPAQLRR
jgi:putative intracellular protease/amidase